MFFGWYKIWTLYPILTKFRLFILRRIGIKKNSFHFSLEIKQRKDRIFISSSFLFSFFFIFSLFNLFLFFLSPAFSQLQPTIEKFIYLLYITTLIIYSTSQSPIYNTPYKNFFFFWSLIMKINTTQITQPSQPIINPKTAPPQPTPSNHWQQVGTHN